MKPRIISRRLVFILLLAAAAALDQTGKLIARKTLSNSSPVSLLGGTVILTLEENPGAFLSLGASLPEGTRRILTILVGLILLGVCIFILRDPGRGSLSFFAASLLCAGGVGNLIDRFLRHGRVTDYIYIRMGPFHTGVFNLADVAITFGVILLFISLAHGKHRPGQEE